MTRAPEMYVYVVAQSLILDNIPTQAQSVSGITVVF